MKPSFFGIGIYKNQLSLIAGFTAIIALCLFISAFKSDPLQAFDQKQKELYVKSATSQPLPDMMAIDPRVHTCVDPDHTSCDGKCSCDGLGCDDQELVHNYQESVVKSQSIEHQLRDYQLMISDNGNKLVLFDKDKPVHVFDRAYSGNKNLFAVIDRDNW